MLRIFRAIRRSAFGEGRLPTYLLYAVGEILLVVVGILIALQVDNTGRSGELAAHEDGRIMRCLLLFLVLIAMNPGAARVEAQEGAPEARPEDVATIDGIIEAYYEVVSGPAGESANVARDRSLHHPSAWVAIAGRDGSGQPRVRVMTLEDYHGTNEPREEAFWEWETDRVVRRSGNMAHVWSSYASARTEGGEPFARGVNSITLFNDGSRWWIMGWMFDSTAGSDSEL